jgi:hypothetical protein
LTNPEFIPQRKGDRPAPSSLGGAHWDRSKFWEPQVLLHHPPESGPTENHRAGESYFGRSAVAFINWPGSVMVRRSHDGWRAAWAAKLVVLVMPVDRRTKAGCLRLPHAIVAVDIVTVAINAATTK